MASFIEELEALDHPYVPFIVQIGNKDLHAFAKRLSYEDQDALTAYQMDEYVRLLASFTVAKKGAISEEQKRRNIFKVRTKREIIDQLLPTIKNEIERRAYEIVGLDMNVEGQKILALETQEERDAYIADLDARLKEAGDAATEEFRTDLDRQPHEELVDRLVQVNLNIKALTESSRAANAHFLFYAVYTEENGQYKHAFNSAEHVRSMSAETIAALANAVQKALTTDLPFASPDEPTPDEPGSPQSGSEQESTDSGASTEEVPSN